MYQSITLIHSSLRWLVLIALIISIFRAARGYYWNKRFTKTDNLTRHWTATIAHVQLMVGMTFYFQSPLVKYFLRNFKTAKESIELLYFGLIHSVVMLLAIVLLTVGSALAKRQSIDRDKFRTMFIWYTAAFIIIIMIVPWPFSPLAQRPYFR